jgi:hypothetical protein
MVTERLLGVALYGVNGLRARPQELRKIAKALVIVEIGYHDPMHPMEIWRRLAAGIHFDALTLFGLLAVSTMLLFYSLEESAPVFVLCFAGSCFMGSAYGFLQGAWPFGVVEGIWGIVAIRKWLRRRGPRRTP